MLKRTSLIAITTITVAGIFGLVACIEKPPKEILGYAPVYGLPGAMDEIKSESPQPIVNPGKIYQYLDYTFQMETGKGIHVINSSNPASPQKLAYIKVGGCSEISIRNNILYTDNYRDLVAINISNLNAVTVSSRVEDVFQAIDQQMPPHQGVYFECVDITKGTVIGWSEKLLNNPKCKN